MKKIVLASVIQEDAEIEKDLIKGDKDLDLVFIPMEEEKSLRREIVDCQALVIADGPVDREMIESMTSCKVIVKQGIGFDGVDLEAAKEKGIVVCNVPDYCVEDVSEFTLALLLNWKRHVSLYQEDTKKGIWDIQSIYSRPWVPKIRSSKNQVLGILGLGRIGKLVAKKAKPFGFEILAYDPYQDRDEVKDLARLVDLDQVLREADFLSVNLPLNEGTRGLLDEEQLAKMKKTAYIINTGRGQVFDEQALYRAIEEGKLAGAALDVLKEEPLNPKEPFLDLDQVSLTPHAAFYTEDSFYTLRRRAFEEALRVLRGEKAENPVVE